ncbi:hypothetical protein D0862_15209, partial [Hortaea werneckii]
MATEANSARIGNYARILNPQQQNLDAFPRDSHRSPLQVLSSMLEQRPRECDLWMQTLRAPRFYGSAAGQQGRADAVPIHSDKKFGNALLGHVSAVADSPRGPIRRGNSCGSTPEAKVVLVDRGVERRLGPRVSRQDYRGLAGCITSITAGFAGNKHEARVRSQAAYRHHYQDVRESGPRERLLEFRLQEGWGPLCEFFGREVPDMPFPHVNKEESNRLAFETIARIGMKRLRRHSMACSSLPDCSAEEFRSSLEPLQRIARYRGEWTTTTEFELGTHHQIEIEMIEKPFVQEKPRAAKKRKLDTNESSDSVQPTPTQVELPEDLLPTLAENDNSPSSQDYKMTLHPTHAPPANDPTPTGQYTTNSTPYPTTLNISTPPHHQPHTFHLPPHSTFSLTNCHHSTSFRNSLRAQASLEDRPRHTFDLILLDPPWPNRSIKRTHRTPWGSNYTVPHTLSDLTDLLYSLDLEMLMSPSSFVGVWITNKPSIREMILHPEEGWFAAWGVELVEEWIWLKCTAKGEP